MTFGPFPTAYLRKPDSVFVSSWPCRWCSQWFSTSMPQKPFLNKFLRNNKTQCLGRNPGKEKMWKSHIPRVAVSTHTQEPIYFILGRLYQCFYERCTNKNIISMYLLATLNSEGKSKVFIKCKCVLALSGCRKLCCPPWMSTRVCLNWPICRRPLFKGTLEAVAFTGR